MKLKNKIKSIIEALKDSDINHIEISSFWGAQKIKLVKDISNKKFRLTDQESNEIYQNKIQEPTEEKNTNISSDNDSSIEDISDESSATIFKSPLVGTFYQSAKPGAPAFVKEGDMIQVRDKSKKNNVFLDSMRRIKSDNPMPWLTLDKSKLTGVFDKIPVREEIIEPLNEQLVVELYSK